MSTNEMQVEKVGPVTADDVALFQAWKRAAEAEVRLFGDAHRVDGNPPFVAAARHAAALERVLAAVPTWIPTGDRMPEPRTPVIAHSLNPFGESCVVAAEYTPPPSVANGWWSDLTWLGDTVTHWMPLPAPPGIPAALSTTTEEA